jgi:4,5-DOPA dioxygenase extradiol
LVRGEDVDEQFADQGDEAPLAIGATTTVPLTYDFWGFPERYYEVTYKAPGAPELASQVKKLLRAPATPVLDVPGRGLDHGAYVPLVEMYPQADVPVLQISRRATWTGQETLARGDLDALLDFQHKAPGARQAHPRTEHFAPLFVTLGAATDELATQRTVIDGFWLGLARRSIQLG